MKGYLLVVARIAWLGTALVSIIVLLAMLPFNYRATLVSDDILRIAPLLRPPLTVHSLARYFVVLQYSGTLAAFLVASVVFFRRGRGLVGIVTALVLVTMPVSLHANAIQVLSRVNPLWPWLQAASQGLLFISLVSLLILVHIFPDGRFFPGWSRWTLLFALGMFGLVGLAELGLGESLGEWVLGFSYMTTFVVLSLAIVGQIFRYRRVSNPVQRQQTKWVLIGLALYLQWLIGPWWWALAGMETPLTSMITRHLDILFPMLIPITLGIAILRHRLWNIDLIIRRTLVYGLVMGPLVLTYIVIVLALRIPLVLFTSMAVSAAGLAHHPVSDVLATLAALLLFSPLRNRIQAAIDQRFYRQRYDAEQTLTSFAGRLREEVDLDALSVAMLDVVSKTMQPAHTSLWLRRDPPE